MTIIVKLSLDNSIRTRSYDITDIELMNSFNSDYVNISDVSEDDDYTLYIYGRHHYAIRYKDLLLAKRIICTRFIFDKTNNIKVDYKHIVDLSNGIKYITLDKFIDMLAIKPINIESKKYKIINFNLSEDNIISYCLGNPISPIWGMFFDSIHSYRHYIKELPKDTSKLYINNELDSNVVLFLNCVVRNNRDYICKINIKNGKRIESDERCPVFGKLVNSIDILVHNFIKLVNKE